MKYNGIIQRKLALLDDQVAKLQEHLIVHQYEEINPEIVSSLATQHLGDFRKFRDEIDRA